MEGKRSAKPGSHANLAKKLYIWLFALTSSTISAEARTGSRNLSRMIARAIVDNWQF
jgi:hypothetical protein